MAVECIVDEWGDKSWIDNGKFHRTDGPAVERISGSKFWFVNGQRHRIDGPAVEYASGYYAWYINDVRYDDINDFCEAAGITGMQKTLFLLTHTGN